MPRKKMGLDNREYRLHLSPLVGQFFENRAKLTGQGVSSVMAMALLEYYEQKHAMDLLPEALKLYQEAQRAAGATQTAQQAQNVEKLAQKLAEPQKPAQKLTGAADYEGVLDAINRKHTPAAAQETNFFG